MPGFGQGNGTALATKQRRQGAFALLRLRLASSSRLRVALLVYSILELISFWRFRQRLKRLRQPRLGYRRATLDELRWLLRAVEHPVCPVRMSKASLQVFLSERSSDARQTIKWEHYYVMVQDCWCILGPSPEEHALLLEIAGKFAEREGLQRPPPRASPPSCSAPVGYGHSPVQVVHKPLPLEMMLFSVRQAADAFFWVWGFRGDWMPTSEGWIRYWLATPKEADPNNLPVVFLHGVGFGAVPYIPFLRRLRHGWASPLLVLELPNCSRCSFQAAMPTPASFRDALERILRKELGITEAGRYMLVGHSLGTDFCSMVMNDPRLAHADPLLRPARLVLLDPVCFVTEVAAAHRLPFWTVREALTQPGARWWKFPFILVALFIFIRDEYTQEATKRAIVPGTDSIFRCSPTMLKRCPTMVCLSGEDEALPAWKIHDYIRAQMPEVNVRMHPTMEHGGFLMVRQWLAKSHADDVLRFLAGSKAQKEMPRVVSLPGQSGASKPSEDLLSPPTLPTTRKACSGSNLFGGDRA